MNDQERAQLEWLKAQHQHLKEQIDVLARHLKAFESAIEAEPTQAQLVSQQVSPSLPGSASPAESKAAFASTATPEVPPVIQPAPAAPALRGPAAGTPVTIERVENLAPLAGTKLSSPLADVKTTATPSGTESKPAKSLELRVGTYWLVRIGIVMVLTAAVFFGNFAYQNLGPGGKVSLLYLTSGILLGAGAWWQRKTASESLRNYALVLFAGGQAGVYFTTYAAHHIEQLRVIPSALTDGILLLLWAGFMVWTADRRKSEVLALFGIGLAYYTSIVTRVESFTLYSNLILAVAAVVFMIRNRWAALSFAGLAASYLAYAFWRFYNGTDWHWASPTAGLWAGAYFLFSYWAVFTAGVFLSRDRKFAGPNRAAFLTLNNGAMFTMFVLTMLQVQQGGFWKFCLGYGLVLLGLALLARRTLPDEPLVTNGYLTQGLLLVTVGFISKFSGLQLSLVLAAESVVLQLLGRQRDNRVLIAASYLTAGLATGWAMDGITPVRDTGLYLALGVGVLMLANVHIAARQGEQATLAPLLRPGATWFSGLALLLFLLATWHYTPRENFPLVLAGEALVLTASIYFLAVPELVLLAQGYIILAHLAWLGFASAGPVPPWWNPALLIGTTAVLAHWWPRQQRLRAWPDLGVFCQALYGLAVVGVLCFWFQPQMEAPKWLALSALLAVLVTVYGVATRWWFLAVAAQILVLVSCVVFVEQLATGKPGWHWMLAPIAAINVLSFGTAEWFKRNPGRTGRTREVLLQIAVAYRWAALAMIIWWVCEYIPERERIWVLGLAGAAVFAGAGRIAKREALLFSAMLTVVALVLFWMPFTESPRIYWPNLLVILVLQGNAIRETIPNRYQISRTVHTAASSPRPEPLAFASLWVSATRERLLPDRELVGAGAGLFHRRHRLPRTHLSLARPGDFGLRVARVVIFDVWKLETLYRIISFMALGIVLLVLGFIYNKYQEKLRQWL